MESSKYYELDIGEVEVTFDYHISGGVPQTWDDPGEPYEVDYDIHVSTTINSIDNGINFDADDIIEELQGLLNNDDILFSYLLDEARRNKEEEKAEYKEGEKF